MERAANAAHRRLLAGRAAGGSSLTCRRFRSDAGSYRTITTADISRIDQIHLNSLSHKGSNKMTDILARHAIQPSSAGSAPQDVAWHQLWPT